MTSRLIIFCAILLTLSQCSFLGLGRQKPDIPFDEFNKILSLKAFEILHGEDASLALVSLPGDDYSKIYRYDHKTQDFKLHYDHGSPISRLTTDRSGKHFYMHIDDNGDENYQIFSYDPKERKAEKVFGKKGFKTELINSDKDHKNLFLISNFADKSVYSIYSYNLQDKELARLSDGKMNFSSAMVSPDGSKVVASRFLSNNENQLYLIDTYTKTSQPLFKKPKSVFHPGFFDENLTTLYGTTDYKRDRMGCARIALRQPNAVYYTHTQKDKDIHCGYDQKMDLYTLTKSHMGRKELKLYRKPFQDFIPLPKIFPKQTTGGWGRDQKTGHLFISYRAANNPGSIYRVDPKTQKYKEILDYNRSSLVRAQMAQSYDLEYESFDGLKVHAIYFAKPEWKSSGKKYPLIIWPHGGPDHFESHRYHPWFQYFALNGFVVLAPNFRGSTGYGKHFETLNDKDWGGGHIRDLIEAKKVFIQKPWVDENNAFILGGSFGGYSTLAALTYFPNSFKAGVGIVAIGNLFTFMESIPKDEAWQTEFLTEIGDPVKDEALYRARSPFFHVDRVQAPLKIYQAENDVRTVKAEMDNYVEALNKAGKEVEYTVLKDVGHGLERPEVLKTIMEGSISFFKSQMEKNADTSSYRR